MTFDITEFGAKAKTGVLNTEAIQKAFDACGAAGGGVVNVPPGVFSTGTVRMRSNTTLNLEPGAVLLGPDSIDGYQSIPFAWDLYPSTNALIFALNERNVRISGSGAIDFNAKAFVKWDELCTGLPADKEELLSPELRASCHYAMPPRELRPNRLIFFESCEDVEVSGPTFRDSPTWTLVFSRCRFVIVRGVHIDNHMQVPNSDGIHCCGCKDVLISGCFISAGDDCIALTGISDFAAVSERIIIESCILRSASSALRIGFQASKIRDVMVRNLIINDSNRAIIICAGVDGFVEDVSISGVIAKTRIFAGPWWGKGEPLLLCAAKSPKARIERVSVKDVKAASENGIVIAGEAGNIQDIELADWSLTLSYGAARPLYGDMLDLSPDPCILAPDATCHIPWFNARGTVNLATERIAVLRAPSEKSKFSTEPIIDQT